MAKKRIRPKRKKINRKSRRKLRRKIRESSSYASLCGIAELINSRGIFQSIHQQVKIQQKKVEYSPTDKLVFMVLGIMSGCEVVFDVNVQLRVDQALLRAFGYDNCADQSGI